MLPTERTVPRLAVLALCAAFAGPLAAQGEAIDAKAIEILRRHGLEQSQVMDHLSWICDVHGPRLTGSTNLARAQDWAAQTFRDWGLVNVALPEWGPFGRSWQLDEFSMRVVGENPALLLAWPKAWSPSLDGEVEAELVNADALTADELAALDLRDKIVMLESPRAVSEWFDGTAQRFDAERLWSMATGATPASATREAAQATRTDFRAGFQKRQAIMNLLRTNRPLMLLDRSSKGDYGTIFVQGASAMARGENERARAQDPGADVIPQATLAVEQYNRLCRLLAKGIRVKLAVRLRTTMSAEARMERNVVAELRGSDLAIGDQVVMLGAHFDSWQSGTGATDHGCGSAVVMEAMRLLAKLVEESGTKPRRTIRAALWSGEEQGLLGSRAWVQQNLAALSEDGQSRILKPEHAKLSGYFNLDNGTGRIRGVYLQGNEAVAPIFRAWLAPFHDLEAATITSSDTGGTDHLSFDGVGVPGFQFIQDPVAYDTRTHHSNMDVWDHAVKSDLEQAATIMAAFAWHAAQRDGMLPRKPMPPVGGDRRRRQ
ncbi:MAG: M20/M25/M40 family metallo-hydrolase [Planctomycetes bacterium]|nr:M20/M25/M40 family metallo-hydrolase [Planctomycetota bacterium]